MFWDPLTGRSYRLTESLCPLQQVFCIFNEDNIWANVQSRITGINVNTDLAKRAFWRPFFHAKHPKPTLASVQIEQLVYARNTVDEISELETMLKMRLTSSFEKERQRLRLFTKWNLYCSRTLKQMLRGVADDAAADPNAGFEAAWIDHTKADQLLGPLARLAETHRLMGVPINFAFTTYTDACERLHRTNMHSINEEHLMEFALAVHVVPYGNGIFSVWVYCATIDKLETSGLTTWQQSAAMSPRRTSGSRASAR